jgi:hypothetical protein
VLSPPPSAGTGRRLWWARGGRVAAEVMVGCVLAWGHVYLGRGCLVVARSVVCMCVWCCVVMLQVLIPFSS